MLVRDGIVLIKIWLAIGRAEQLRQFLQRESDPLKQWKLSQIDIDGLSRWHDYTAAIAETFALSHLPIAPWTVIWGEDKRRARIAAMRSGARPPRLSGQGGRAARSEDLRRPRAAARQADASCGGRAGAPISRAMSTRGDEMHADSFAAPLATGSPTRSATGSSTSGVPLRRFVAWCVDVVIVLLVGVPLATVFGLLTLGVGFAIFPLIVAGVGFLYRTGRSPAARRPGGCASPASSSAAATAAASTSRPRCCTPRSTRSA